MKRALAALAGLCIAAVPVPAAAHARSQSFSVWDIDGEHVTATWSLLAREATRLPPDPRGPGVALARHLAAALAVRRAGAACPLAARPLALAARRGYLRVELRWRCPAGTARYELQNAALFDLVPSHVHFSRVHFSRGDAAQVEYLFTDSERVHAVGEGPPLAAAPAETKGTSFASYAVLGLEHILSGLDHLAFLLALLLLTRRLRDVLFIVTGFTLGHSITLSLAVLGLAQPNAPLIEAMIGFTIALVAVENIGASADAGRALAWWVAAGLAGLALWGALRGAGPPPHVVAGLGLFSLCYLRLSSTREAALRLRPAVTALFGLVHGFGFASVLIEAGLPGDRVLVPLLGFNLGVEAGQIAVVSALWIAGGLVRQRTRSHGSEWRGLAIDAASAALCALGLFWFLGRGYGAAG